MSRAYDAIVLLGVELDAQERPTQELHARVYAAAQAYARGAAGVIVASGGRLPGHRVEEATVMARLLCEAGVPKGAVMLEDQSQNTMENMRYSAQKLGGAKGRRVLVVTSDYHLRRAVLTARRVGFRARGCAAALEHDALWRKKRNHELAYTVDLLMGWQDEGKSRPRWTYAVFDAVFGQQVKKGGKNA
ncbi:MAG: YdcF family protein [Clostridiales bacterium]|nr:YdcF family protein [Clostridiales bacterium]